MYETVLPLTTHADNKCHEVGTNKYWSWDKCVCVYVTARFATSGPFQSRLARFEAVQPAISWPAILPRLCRSICGFEPIQPGDFEANC